MTYSLLDSTGLCINHVAWDGISNWQPPEGCQLVEAAFQIGKSYRFDTLLNKWVNQSAAALPTYEELRLNADYPAFWDSLLAGTVYSAIRTQSMASLPMNTLATEFIALLGDAKAGRPNEAAIQASMEAILATGTFTQDHLAELQAALATGRIETIYTLPVPIPGDG
jgi:hypothetical protein